VNARHVREYLWISAKEELFKENIKSINHEDKRLINVVASKSRTKGPVSSQVTEDRILITSTKSNEELILGTYKELLQTNTESKPATPVQK